jgi:hypothetical protein
VKEEKRRVEEGGRNRRTETMVTVTRRKKMTRIKTESNGSIARLVRLKRVYGGGSRDQPVTAV